MKTLIQDYTFNALAKTITINELPSISIEQMLIVTNVTDGIIIYNFADSSLSATVLGNVLTLNYDTTTMSNLDSLQIFVEIANTNYVELNELLREGVAEIVHQLQSIRNDGGMADVNGRVRVAIENGSVGLSSNQTLGTLTTLANMAGIGGYSPSQYVMSQTNQAWGNLRRNITVS